MTYVNSPLSYLEINGNIYPIDQYVHPTTASNVGTYGPSSAITTNGNITFNVPKITVDSAGHVTSASNVAITHNQYVHPSAATNTGTYGPSSDVTGSNGNTISVPQITVNSAGHVTSISNKTYTSKDTIYTHPNTASNVGSFGASSAVTTNGNITFNVPKITINEAGHVTSATNIAITHNQYVHPTTASNVGTFGPSSNVTGSNGNTISIPQITVNSAGHVTSISNKTYTSVDHTYTVGDGLLEIGFNDEGFKYGFFNANNTKSASLNFKSGQYISVGAGYIGTSDHDLRINIAHTTTASNTGTFGPNTLTTNGNITFNVPKITIDSAGHVSSASNVAITHNQYVHPNAASNTGTFGPNTLTTNGNITFNVPQITVNSAGHITSAKNIAITHNQYVHPNVDANTTPAKIGGPTEVNGVIGTNNTTVNIPFITVDSKGHVISLSNRTYTSKDTIYTHPYPSTDNTVASIGPTNNVTGSNNTTIVVPYFSIDALGHVSYIGQVTYTSVDTIPNNGTLTLNGQNGSASFTADQSGNTSKTFSLYAKTLPNSSNDYMLELGIKIS